MNLNVKPSYDELLLQVKQLTDVHQQDLLNIKRLQQALDSVKIGIHDWDVASNRFIWDQRMCELWGIPAESEITMELILKGVHPEDQSYIQSEIKELVTSKQIDKYSLQYRVIGVETGIFRWVELSGKLFYENDKLIRIVGTASDISQRIINEKALHKSEKHYKELFQNLNSNFAVHELILDETGTPYDYRFLEVNEAMEKATGLKASEMIGKTARELFPDTEQYWIDKFAEVVNSGKSTEYENFSKEMGRYFELKLYSPGKNLFAMLATDVTERKLAILKLKEAKEHFEQLFNLNPDAVNIVRLRDHRITDVNIGFSNLIGFSNDEAVGNTTLELNIWAIPADRDLMITELMEHGHCANIESTFRTKKGELIFGIVSALVIVIYDEPHILSVTRDITKRKEMEIALAHNAKVLNESQKIAGLGSYKLNINTGRWDGSEILDEIFGIDSSYDKSINGWINLIHPEWQESMMDYLANEIITKHNRFDKEYKIIRVNDKKELWIHGLGELLFDGEGTLVFMTGTIMDITERKNTELIIQKQNKDLQDLNATKDKLFSIIAHDLKSPFNSLLNLSELLANAIKSHDYELLSHWAEHINTVSKQTYTLLENLLEWFRVQTGEMQANIKKCSLKSIVDDVVILNSEVASRKNIQIENQITSASFVFCDKDMTHAIIRNLISNAIKFSYSQSVITINVETSSYTTHISIKDSGVGIAPATLTSLFSISNNKSTMGTANERGSGLGLLLCKDLVEKQGGNIWAESILGLGSTFHFTIPFSNESLIKSK